MGIHQTGVASKRGAWVGTAGVGPEKACFLSGFDAEAFTFGGRLRLLVMLSEPKAEGDLPR